MNSDTYKKRKDALAAEYKIKNDDVDRQYAAANSLPVEVGDVLHTSYCTGAVTGKMFSPESRDGRLPEMGYHVVAHTKKGAPRKDGATFTVMQSYITHINGEAV